MRACRSCWWSIRRRRRRRRPIWSALAKEKPGTLSFGTSGTGTASHLFAELFKTQTGIEVTHVPYKSMVQPLNDVLGGHLDYMFSDLSPALPLVRDGKLRALGVTSATRVPTASEIPTLAEAGVPGYEAVAWLMIATRAGLPPDILAKLHGELKAILAQPEIQRADRAVRHDPGGQPIAGGVAPLCRLRDGALEQDRAAGRRGRHRIAAGRPFQDRPRPRYADATSRRPMGETTMKLCRYDDDRLGVVIGDMVHDVTAGADRDQEFDALHRQGRRGGRGAAEMARQARSRWRRPRPASRSRR